MGLTKNFTLHELCFTKENVVNEPTEQQVEKLLYLANYLLQPIRSRFGVVLITSAFRSQELNKLIKGSSTSQHLKGEAADFIVYSKLEDCYVWCRDTLAYGQIILEKQGLKRWIHISLPRIGGTNQQALLFDNGIYTVDSSPPRSLVV